MLTCILADATNSTRARRKALFERIKREPGLKLLFIESICTDPAVIAANVAVKVASGDPDYDGMPPEQAERDFRERIKHYEESYEPLDPELDKELTWCQMVNVGKQVRATSLQLLLSELTRAGAGHGQQNRRLPPIADRFLPHEPPPHAALDLLYTGASACLYLRRISLTLRHPARRVAIQRRRADRRRCPAVKAGRDVHARSAKADQGEARRHASDGAFA